MRTDIQLPLLFVWKNFIPGQQIKTCSFIQKFIFRKGICSSPTNGIFGKYRCLFQILKVRSILPKHDPNRLVLKWEHSGFAPLKTREHTKKRYVGILKTKDKRTKLHPPLPLQTFLYPIHFVRVVKASLN